MVQKTVAIWIAAPLEYLLITVKIVPLEKLSVSEIQNPKADSQHIDSRWEALSAY